ncbi:nucleopolyhedrovirus P10 family protein, partial [Streptomyces sp. SID5785]|nr:nucleopolyhedrovirus P10 family protein [Streptomyces sp. SID5785]
EPLPAAAERLRTALAGAAQGRLGLVVAEVDVRVTELLTEPLAPPAADAAAPGVPAGPDGPDEPDGPDVPEATSGAPRPVPAGDTDRAVEAALAVPGVLRPATAPVGLGRSVHIEERAAGEGAALPRRHVRVELVLARDARALDVARAVREAVGAALPDTPTVAVLVMGFGDLGD